MRIRSRTAFALGTGALLVAAWASMYGKLWSFERMGAHRLTAAAILSGTLRLRGVLGTADHDEQIYNGAVYTNWGFGVPLLQLPFHAIARVTGQLSGFFPDRAIFFVYMAALIPIVVVALDRLLADRPGPATPRSQRLAASCAATFLALSCVLFPLLSTRFIIFEETIAYMVIFELLALSAYILAARGGSPALICAMGGAAGIGLLIRPTGAVYVAVWGLLVLLQHRWKRAAVFAATVAPFAVFWLYGNWVRTGSPLGLGYENSNPAWGYEMPILRFGSRCADTPWHTLQAAARLFTGFFFFVSPRSSSAWLAACHFDFEERDHVGDPFFGPAVLLLLVWMLRRHVLRRERRVSVYVPYGALVLLFAMFVRRGDGFAWRYVGDFWPLILLACAQHVQVAPPGATRTPDLRLAKVLFWCGFAVYARFLVPWEWTYRAETVPASETPEMRERFLAARWGHDEPMASRIACSDPLFVPYNNGLGWKPGCRVSTFTNVYLGVPRKSEDQYRIRLQTEGITAASVQVYLNGRMYEARRRAQGDGYEADVRIQRAAMTTPVVVATVHWADDDAPDGRLLSIELV